MATPTVRSGLRLLARGNKRSFSSATHHLHYDEAHEAGKWEKITYAGIAICTILAIYNLSKGHHEYPEPPPYPYLHIRNKDFPWGQDSLFQTLKKPSKHD